MEYLPIDYFQRAWSAKERGDLDAEISQLKELVSLCQLTEEPADHYAEALRWLGNAYEAKGDLLRAHGYRLEAFDVVKHLSSACSDYVEMTVRGDVGRSFIELAEWNEAESHTRAALAVAERRGDGPSETCIYRLNLALIFANTGRENDARELGEQVLLDASTLSTPDYLVARQHLNLASLHLHAKRLDLSQTHAALAVSHADASGDRSIAILARKVLGKCRVRQWKETGQEEFAAAAKSLLEHVLSSASDQKDFAAVADIELELAVLSGRSGGGLDVRHCEAAIEALEKARTTLGFDETTHAFFSQWAPAYDSVMEFQLRRGDVATAFRTSERSRNRLLLARLGTGNRNSQKWPQDQRTALAAAQAGYGTEVIRTCRSHLKNARERGWRRTFGLRSVRAPETSADPQPIVDARTAYLAIQDRQRLYSSRWTNSLMSQTFGSIEIRRRLRSQDAMIAFHTTPSSIVAFVLTQEGLHANQMSYPDATLIGDIQQCCDLITLLEENSLARLDNPILRREWWSRRVGQPHPDDIEQPLQRLLARLQHLFAILIEPLLSVLAPKRNWVIVPHGPLHRVPWHALWTGREYLIESHNVAVLPSGSFAVALQQQHLEDMGSDVLLLGAPDSADDPLGLPGAAAELTATRDALRLSVSPLVGNMATRQQFFDRAPAARLIHLAAHHFFDAAAPGLSFLKLAGNDGSEFLYAGELAEMRLSAQLAVLSACDTARSQVVAGDEQYGIVRSFFAAGVRSVISTLWAVEDQSAALIFKRFHEASKSVPLIEALANAQRTVMKEPPYDLPYFWAPFVLSGEWAEPLRLS